LPYLSSNLDRFIFYEGDGFAILLLLRRFISFLQACIGKSSLWWDPFKWKSLILAWGKGTIREGFFLLTAWKQMNIFNLGIIFAIGR
jgi:hypothetical protein